MLRVLRDYEISQRRACGLIGVDPKTVRRERPPDHSVIRDAMKEVAGKRRRFGYRRIGVMLERQGMIMNHKKLYRLYREEGLSVRRRRGRKRARGSRTPMPLPLRPGVRWSMDFVSDTFGASRKFRILAINDDCCRENLCLVADPVHDLAHQVPHLTIVEMGDIIPRNLAPIGINDANIRIVTGMGDRADARMESFEARIADAHHSERFRHHGGNAFFVIPVHRRTIAANPSHSRPEPTRTPLYLARAKTPQRH